MKLYSKFFYVSGLVFLLGGSSLFGAEQSAKEILDKAYTYVGSMDKYAFDALVLDDDVENGKVTREKYRHDVSVKVDRPGKLRVDTKGNVKERSSTLNDGVFTMIDYGFGYYSMLKTPKSIDAALDAIFERYGIRAPLAQLVYSDMQKRFKFSKSKNFGPVMVDGTECHYVAFADALVEVHIWITTGDKPLVKAYKLFDITEKERPSISTWITWDAHPNITDKDFVATLPKDAAQISVLPVEK
jgi:hypothetical protein